MRFLRFFSVLCFLFLSGCSRETPNQSTPIAPNTVPTQTFPRDDLGRAVNLKAPAARVVCIGPGATETIFALGAGSQLVGRDQFSNYPAAALKVPVAGDYTGPFIEKVIALRPDLIIVQGETYDKARAENWQQKIGAPVVILVPTSVEKVAEGIIKLSKWLGDEKEKNNLVWNLLKPRGPFWEIGTFVEIQRSPLWTAGKGTLIDDVLYKSGFYNRGASDGSKQLKGYKQFNIEYLLAMKPYYLDSYTVPATKSDRNKILAELSLHPLLSKLDCIKKGQVVVIDADLILRPGPRLALGIDRLRNQAKELYRIRRDREDKKME